MQAEVGQRIAAAALDAAASEPAPFQQLLVGAVVHKVCSAD